MIIQKKIFYTFLLTSVIFFGCDDSITVVEVDNKIIPESNVSFSEHIYPVFQVKCAFSGCHIGPGPQAGLDLSTWATATADPNVIFPGQPDLSSLIWTIDPNVGTGFPQMPPIGYRALTENQLNGIRIWIKEGAKNN